MPDDVPGGTPSDLGVLLVVIARQAIESQLRGAASPTLPNDPRLAAPASVFVTIHVARTLRGCIGRMDATCRLGEVIAQCAVAAATADPRFEPIGIADLAELSIQVSVLTPLRCLEDPSLLEVGRHGLVIEQGRKKGLLLPQVAVEHGWSAVEFLEHTCRKAGLPRDGWRNGASLFVFEAEVFGEGA